MKYLDEQNKVQYVTLYHITTLGASKAYTTFEVPDTSKNIRFQIDTGASCDVLSWQDYISVTRDKQASLLAETKKILVMHNKTKVIRKGSAQSLLQRNGHTYKVHLFVIPGLATPLLSFKSSQQLGLVRIVDSDHLHMVTQQPIFPTATGNHKDTDQSSYDTSNDSILLDFKVVFEGLDCLPGHYSIRLDDNAASVVHALRRAPVALKVGSQS